MTKATSVGLSRRRRGSSNDPTRAGPDLLAVLREQAFEAAALLLDAIDRADRARGGAPLRRVTDEALYQALVAVLLGTVFVECAGQRGLIASADDDRSFARVLARRATIRDELGGRMFELEVPFCDLVDDASFGRVLALLLSCGSGRHPVAYGELPVEVLGQLYEGLSGYAVERHSGERRLARSKGRKRTGSFYTPRALTEPIVKSALERWTRTDTLGDPEAAAVHLGALRVCDPSMGGGAFLLEVLRQLGAALGAARRRAGVSVDPCVARRVVAERCLFGVDLSPLAVAVAEASLWLLVGDPAIPIRGIAHLRHGEALLGRGPAAVAEGQLTFSPSEPAPSATELDWVEAFPAVFSERGGFDLVIGNPPWVAFAGRAAQPLEPALRARYARAYFAMRGYPTLHGMFVERSAALAPSGTLALLLPSPIADLDGYRAVRRAVTARHVVREPLLEFGQDAFESVVQPCFALVADADPEAVESDRAWCLVERQRAASAAEAVRVPEVLELIGRAPPLPASLFREMGFQSSGAVSRTLFLRAPEPDAEHRYPLLEGRDVSEFRQGTPRLYLCADRDKLRRAGARLRPPEDYRQVEFVVRQTAKMPIAALHSGLPFRNSLLAGLAVEGISAELAVALLNSALYRALHLASRRDARQAAFPQVKLAHLRALPKPPALPALRAKIERITRSATGVEMTPALRSRLDTAVFELFAVPLDHRRAVLSWIAGRVPELYPRVEPPGAGPLSVLAPVSLRLGLPHTAPSAG